MKKNKFEAKLVEKEQTKKQILNWNGKKETEFELSYLGAIYEFKFGKTNYWPNQ